MDTIVLGLFVANELIAFYEIAWNLASLLAIFGVAIAETLFPELSKLAAEDAHDRIRSLLDDALAYAGLFLIPGLVGSFLVGTRVLAIYDQEYTRAAVVLVVLVAARLVYAYGSQFTNALNGLDRPELAFRVNGVFAAANVSGNLVLVYLYGWLGAAVATALSALVALLMGYRYVDNIVGITFPYGELVRQIIATAVMAAVLLLVEPRLAETVPWTVIVVGVGAAIYVTTLSAISGRFRATLARNLPI